MWKSEKFFMKKKRWGANFFTDFVSAVLGKKFGSPPLLLEIFFFHFFTLFQTFLTFFLYWNYVSLKWKISKKWEKLKNFYEKEGVGIQIFYRVGLSCTLQHLIGVGFSSDFLFRSYDSKNMCWLYFPPPPIYCISNIYNYFYFFYFYMYWR